MQLLSWYLWKNWSSKAPTRIPRLGTSASKLPEVIQKGHVLSSHPFSLSLSLRAGQALLRKVLLHQLGERTCSASSRSLPRSNTCEALSSARRGKWFSHLDATPLPSRCRSFIEIYRVIGRRVKLQPIPRACSSIPESATIRHPQPDPPS